jgi:selenide, water dikinase
VEAASKDERPVHAVTDVTGFGLLGHAREMAIGSGVSMKIDHKQIAYLPGAVEAARGHFFSGGMKNNRDFCESCVGFAGDVTEEFRALLFDPQTSGGLFVSIAPEAADSVLAAFERHKVPASAIGEIIPRRSPLIEIA